MPQPSHTRRAATSRGRRRSSFLYTPSTKLTLKMAMRNFGEKEWHSLPQALGLETPVWDTQIDTLVLFSGRSPWKDDLSAMSGSRMYNSYLLLSSGRDDWPL